jgi:hypothetical protein
MQCPKDLRRRDVVVVRARQVIGIRRAQKAQAVRQYFDALADNVGFLNRELLEMANNSSCSRSSGLKLWTQVVGEQRMRSSRST